MEIPITIAYNGNSAYLHKELFGLGEEETNPEILKYFTKKETPLRRVNESVTIIDGVTLSPKKEKIQIKESVDFEPVDYGFILLVIETALLTKDVYEIAGWLIDKTEKLGCKVKIAGKEVKTKDELKKALEEYINSKKGDDEININ